MFENAITLDSLLETYESPFVIIDASLTIVGLNKAWEKLFGRNKSEQIGKPCCKNSPNCRHQKLFKQLEPYESTATEPPDTHLKVRGYPLLDIDGKVYLGESISKASFLQDNQDNGRMVGSSEQFMAFKNNLSRAARTLAPVFLMGETGTGKELAAEYIHTQSRLKANEFVIVDCTVLNEELFESELFGHEKGAFTGATTAKKGLFELANHGTLFLDEIAELPLSQQPKLLRALETGQFRRVGGTKLMKSNVRIISATHQNLADRVQSGKFREDLFYRLSVFPITIPPLRQRRRDIPELTLTLLKQISLREESEYSIDKAAVIKLIHHQWPGNIRELKNCIQLAASLCQDFYIHEEDITYLQQPNDEPQTQQSLKDEEFNQKKSSPLLHMEKQIIQELLEKHQGNRKLIAEEMNISERTLYRKLKRFDLN